MRRFLLVLAAAALVVAACGDSSTDDTVPQEPAEAATTTATSTTEAPATTTSAPDATITPTTATATTTAPAIVPGEDPDVDAIVTAFTVAFDSVSEYAEKAPYIDDPSGLEDTVASYLTTGEAFGGIGVLVTAVVVSGDQAEVTYDLLFNNNPAYSDQTGAAVLTDAGWQVPRDVFCGLMQSARVGCPSE